jgi:hypothetical protein
MSLTDLHIALSLALLYSQFCRAVKTDASTKLPILLAFYLLTAAVVFSLFAPLVVPNWRATPDSIFMLFAILALQAVTAFHWRHGVPFAFRENPDDDFQDSRPVD